MQPFLGEMPFSLCSFKHMRQADCCSLISFFPGDKHLQSACEEFAYRAIGGSYNMTSKIDRSSSCSDRDRCTFPLTLFRKPVSNVSRWAGRPMKTAAERTSRQRGYTTRSKNRRRRYWHMMMHTSA